MPDAALTAWGKGLAPRRDSHGCPMNLAKFAAPPAPFEVVAIEADNFEPSPAPAAAAEAIAIQRTTSHWDALIA